MTDLSLQGLEFDAPLAERQATELALKAFSAEYGFSPAAGDMQFLASGKQPRRFDESPEVHARVRYPQGEKHIIEGAGFTALKAS